MRKEEKLVQSVIETEQSLKELTVDKINETPDVELEPQTKLTNRQLADSLGCKYIEPLSKLKAIGTLPEKLRKQHARDWEYVKGIYENINEIGQAITFSLCLYPGDPDCVWKIPANTPVYVPRMVANHLENVQQYHTFSHVEKAPNQLAVDEFTDEFQVTGTMYRGKFRPIGAFA